MLVCLIWALNVVVGRIVLATMAVPPFYYAAARFVLVAAVLSPLLLPLPEQVGRIAVAGLLLGAAHFGLLFLGLSAATPSSAAIVLQLGIPLTALLSVAFLDERMSALRITGAAIAFAGVVLMIWSPTEAEASLGLVAIAGSAAALAVGSILLKRLRPIAPLRLQAWVALVSFGPLAAVSALVETGQWSSALHGGWMFLAALGFSVLIVTVWAHTAFFGLLQKYDASLVSPLTLAMPIMTIALGVLITGDQLGPRALVGSALGLAGVAMVIRGGSRRPAAAAR